MAKRGSTIKLLPSVFIDSSTFFTAVNSPTGGSAKVFSLSGKSWRLTTSPLVLAETERNVRKKLMGFHLERFFTLAEKIEILDQQPNDKLIKKAKQAIVEKDAVILAEAKQTEADCLLTLDVRHFITESAKRFVEPTKIVTPKDLLAEVN